MAASNALPPWVSTSAPMSDASGESLATMPVWLRTIQGGSPANEVENNRPTTTAIGISLRITAGPH